MNDPTSPGNWSTLVPQGDNRPRLVCDTCGFVNYINPRIVVGTVAVHDGRILMCRRAIEPREGHWTLPAGFMEVGETTAEGAARETREEACAQVEIDTLIGIYNVTRIGQVHMFYRAHLPTPDFAAGDETLDAALMTPAEIPWQDLAFPSVRWALEHYLETKDDKTFTPFCEPERDNPWETLKAPSPV